MSRRGVAFVGVLIVCVLVSAGWVLISARTASTTSTARAELASTARTTDGGAAVKLGGRLLVRTVDPSQPHLNGRLAEATLGTSGRAVDSGGLACQRVYVAAGAGLCLALAPSGVEYRARIFDRHHRVRHELTLVGLPSRARVSPAGRWGALTTFASGDSYTAPGQFSTRTWILDMRSGRRVADLERFEVLRGDKRLDSPDFNFWGVTFAGDEDTFYATLATGGKRYLVKGSLAQRRVELLNENVECPSLSPDGTRLAYKRRTGGVQDWRLHVLDLRTGGDVALAERRSIDDQAEWLNNETVVYGDGSSVWAARADGAGQPQRLLKRADSPVALRG
jgi:hypothetical protein